MSSSTTNIRFAILEAPSILGLRPSGVERLPEALLSHGLEQALQARRAGRVEPASAYNPKPDPETKMLNTQAIADYTQKLADAVGIVLDRKEFPLVLGGDCSILLGPMLALRRRGRFGLLFIDGHADFYQPEANPNGEAASMDLALATGRGPGMITDVEQRRPLVRDEDVFVFGYRDGEEQRQYGSQPLPKSMHSFDLSTVRKKGIGEAAQEAVEHIARRDLEGFWIHLDADCLDDRIMPAVDYRMENGLSWVELATILQVAIASGQAVGLEVTIYNPSLDLDGNAGRGLAQTLMEALSSSSVS